MEDSSRGPAKSRPERPPPGGHFRAQPRRTIEWNAPSFRYAGNDRVTFRLYPEHRVQLVFHRGSKVKRDGRDFVFDDGTGLLEWVAHDRAVVALRDAKDIEAKQTALVDIVNRWILM